MDTAYSKLEGGKELIHNRRRRSHSTENLEMANYTKLRKNAIK